MERRREEKVECRREERRGEEKRREEKVECRREESRTEQRGELTCRGHLDLCADERRVEEKSEER